MDPKMMQQMQQQMMSNPAMMKQAADQMSNMSSEEMKQKLDQAASGGVPGMPAPKAPAPAQTVVEKLKASPMDVPADVIEVRGTPQTKPREKEGGAASATCRALSARARPGPSPRRAKLEPTSSRPGSPPPV